MYLNEAITILDGLMYESDLDRLKALRRIKRVSKAPTDRLIALLKKKAERDSARKPKFIGQIGYLKLAWSFDGKKDTYIHYTTRENAKKILKTNMLDSKNSDNPMFRESNFAISMTFGGNHPGVQRGTVCGLRNARECDIVAIVFKSDVQPKVGYQDEVIFRGRTRIKSPVMYDITSPKFKSIISKLNGMPGVTQDHVDSMVFYTAKDIESAKKEAENFVQDPDDADMDWQGFDNQ